MPDESKNRIVVAAHNRAAIFNCKQQTIFMSYKILLLLLSCMIVFSCTKKIAPVTSSPIISSPDGYYGFGIYKWHYDTAKIGARIDSSSRLVFGRYYGDSNYSRGKDTVIFRYRLF
jgi:hypothetical protein